LLKGKGKSMTIPPKLLILRRRIIIFVQPDEKLRVAVATKIAKDILKELEEIISNSNNSLSNLEVEGYRNNSYKNLESLIKYYSQFYSSVNAYLNSENLELEALKAIINTDVCDSFDSFTRMGKVKSYLRFKMQQK
jgi:hypothetical protein